MKVLLFGASGQIGADCLQEANRQDIPIVALSRDDANFAQPEIVYNAVMHHKPTVVLNAAAYTDVDKAEDNAALATLINTTSVAMIAKACEELNIPLYIYHLTNVFDGQALQPYQETATTAPLNVYGTTKEQGEKNCSEYMPSVHNSKNKLGI